MVAYRFLNTVGKGEKKSPMRDASNDWKVWCARALFRELNHFLGPSERLVKTNRLALRPNDANRQLDTSRGGEENKTKRVSQRLDVSSISAFFGQDGSP